MNGLRGRLRKGEEEGWLLECGADRKDGGWRLEKRRTGKWCGKGNGGGGVGGGFGERLNGWRVDRGGRIVDGGGRGRERGNPKHIRRDETLHMP